MRTLQLICDMAMGRTDIPNGANFSGIEVKLIVNSKVEELKQIMQGIIEDMMHTENVESTMMWLDDEHGEYSREEATVINTYLKENLEILLDEAEFTEFAEI